MTCPTVERHRLINELWDVYQLAETQLHGRERDAESQLAGYGQGTSCLRWEPSEYHQRWTQIREVAKAARELLLAPTSEAEQSMKLPQLAESEAILRKLLWLRHGCPVEHLYGDDGEMRCGTCGLDFLRHTPVEISTVWNRKAMAKLARLEPWTAKGNAHASPASSAPVEGLREAVIETARKLINPKAMRALADNVVAWDGAGEEGCVICEGEYADEEKVGREAAYATVGDWTVAVVLHAKDCPVVAHRLAIIDELVSQDPAAASPKGVQLQRLASVQAAFEKLVYPLRTALARDAGEQT